MNHMELAVVVIVPLIAFHWRTWTKLDRLMKKLAVEHEILVDDYCSRRSTELGRPFTRTDLPTRHNGAI